MELFDGMKIGDIPVFFKGIGKGKSSIMEIELKTLLINAIAGGNIPRAYTAMSQLERSELLNFCGNQWNESWVWNKINLEKLSLEELVKIYNLYNK